MLDSPPCLAGLLGGADFRGQREDIPRDGLPDARPDVDRGKARRAVRRLRRGRQPGQVRLHRHSVQRQAHRPGATEVSSLALSSHFHFNSLALTSLYFTNFGH